MRTWSVITSCCSTAVSRNWTAPTTKSTSNTSPRKWPAATNSKHSHTSSAAANAPKHNRQAPPTPQAGGASLVTNVLRSCPGAAARLFGPRSRKTAQWVTCTQNLKRRLTRRPGVTRCRWGSGRTVTCCCCGFGGTNAALLPRAGSDARRTTRARRAGGRYSGITVSPASPVVPT